MSQNVPRSISFIFIIFELLRLRDLSQIVDLIFAVRTVSSRASETSKISKWWQNKIPKENRSENKVTTLTLGSRSVNNLRSQSFLIKLAGSIWFLNDFEPGVPKLKQCTNSLFKYFLTCVWGCDFLFRQRKKSNNKIEDAIQVIFCVSLDFPRFVSQNH